MNYFVLMFAVEEAYRFKQVADICDLVTKDFGGYSLIQMDGGWVNKEGEIVQEPSLKLELVTELGEKSIIELCEYIATNYKQDEVYYYQLNVEPKMYENPNKKKEK
tara:strand:+ start:1584 stop:1901 length:318 start_codon:yes stop_codon:yes gene_type:complete